MGKSTPKFWDIPPLHRSCSECQAAFEPEQAYLSVLCDGMDPLRLDYCRECMSKATDGLSKWKGVVSPFSKKTFQQDDYRLLEILEDLLSADQEPETAYFIAQYLRRKGFFRQCQTLRRKGEVFELYEMHDQEKTLAVPHYSLNPETAALQKEKIIQRLESDASTE